MFWIWLTCGCLRKSCLLILANMGVLREVDAWSESLPQDVASLTPGNWSGVPTTPFALKNSIFSVFLVQLQHCWGSIQVSICIGSKDGPKNVVIDVCKVYSCVFYLFLCTAALSTQNTGLKLAQFWANCEQNVFGALSGKGMTGLSVLHAAHFWHCTNGPALAFVEFISETENVRGQFERLSSFKSRQRFLAKMFGETSRFEAADFTYSASLCLKRLFKNAEQTGENVIDLVIDVWLIGESAEVQLEYLWNCRWRVCQAATTNVSWFSPRPPPRSLEPFSLGMISQQ